MNTCDDAHLVTTKIALYAKGSILLFNLMSKYIM
jgi:hypothetical protein